LGILQKIVLLKEIVNFRLFDRYMYY